jgi:hypothetical protein
VTDPGAECEGCGAAVRPGLLACSFCERPYPGRAGTGGVRCPSCADMNARGQAACATCNTALVSGCVFCGQASPLEAPQCLGCGEAFAGAEERKKQRDESRSSSR